MQSDQVEAKPRSHISFETDAVYPWVRHGGAIGAPISTLKIYKTINQLF